MYPPFEFCYLPNGKATFPLYCILIWDLSSRHHIYEKRGGPKSIELKEIGPRFELRLYQVIAPCNCNKFAGHFYYICCHCIIIDSYFFPGGAPICYVCEEISMFKIKAISMIF